MNEWDQQIEALKRKHGVIDQVPVKKRAGRCSCGSGKFGLKIENSNWLRFCHECKKEKEV
ncbi:hypothetical protein ACTHQ4_02275 [Alkalicoccobacillus gibsonii]|uniref:hypothetical protein n=1 Tax=Alkalicoccobacillus gibsonii TaxID=79881 RepID=UPI003F7B4CAA